MKIIYQIIFFMFFTLSVSFNSFSQVNIDSLKNELKQVLKDSIKVELLNKVSFYWLKENTDSALFYIKQALTLSNNLNNSFLIANSLYKHGLVYLYRYRNDSAIYYFLESTSYYKKENNYFGIAKNASAIGNIYKNKSDYNKAIEYYNNALSLFLKIENEKAAASVLGNLGVVHQTTGNFDKALDHFFASLKVKQKLNDEIGTCNTYNNIAVAFDDQGNNIKALEYFNKALELSIKLNYTRITATSYTGLGIIYTRLNQYDKALDYILKSIELKRKLNYKQGLIISYNAVSEIYSSLNNFSLALSFYDKSLVIAKKIESTEDQSNTLLHLGILHNKYKKYNVAVNYFNESIYIAKQIENKVLLESAYQGISISYQHLNNINKELEYYKLYTVIKDSIFNIDKTKKIAEIQTDFEVYQKEQQIILLSKDKEIQAITLANSQDEVNYQSNLKYLIILLASTLLIVGLVLFYTYRIKKKNKEDELEKLNLATENKLLRTQMNPHFIFNSLNSIQNFVLKNEAILASQYLADFATLMRAILDNSKHSFIELGKELETLELYLKLEQIRFDNKFLYQINYDSNLETDFILVPPMILQPFIENAILHGILNKKENGNITIDISDKGDLLYCIIEDNGIGREKAQKIKEDTLHQAKHASLGLQLNKERIEVLNKELGTQGKILITDLYDKQTPRGTKVEIFLPIKN